MNGTIRNIFKFLRIVRISQEEFERVAEIPMNCLNDKNVLQFGLSRDEMGKVCKAFWKQFDEHGFACIDTKGFSTLDPEKGDIHLSYLWKEEDNPYEKGSEEWVNWLIDHHIKSETIERLHQKKVIIKFSHWSDSVMQMNWNDFSDIVNNSDYKSRGIINGEYIFEYTANPKLNLETIIYFNPDGTVDDVSWSA